MILINQLCQGTQFDEQVSLSLALLDDLANRRGKCVVLTSDCYLVDHIDRIANRRTLAVTSLTSDGYAESDIVANLQSLSFGEEFLADFRTQYYVSESLSAYGLQRRIL